MKVYHYLLLLITIVICAQSANASHALGGEIGWNCLPNGKYQFYMRIYRDCTGVTWTFEDESIEIAGSPLPKDATGAEVNSILLQPDSVHWAAERFGNTAPLCTDEYGSPLGCGRNSNGIVQEFFYKSSPITLAGTPPRSGWRFVWITSCCRPNDLDNIFTNGVNPRLMLRAEMLPNKNKDNVDPCIDSSPEFRGLPVSAICRGYEFTNNITAVDRDLDSLTFDWDQPLDPPAASPLGLVYKAGYGFNNPTPDSTFDSRNIKATLNRTSGALKMGIYSGSGPAKYLMVQRVTAWRERAPIARIYRELPLTVLDCPDLPNGSPNTPPSVLIDGKKRYAYEIQAVAGEKIEFPIEIEDLDKTGAGSQLQKVSLVPDGIMFSKNRKDPIPCQIYNGLVDPCAIFNDTDPILDVTNQPPTYKIEGAGALSTNFIWQTDCRHIQRPLSNIYNFVMRITDDHCPIPAINYSTISVRLTEPTALMEPIVKGISIGLDGLATYQWAAPIDSANAFKYYHSEISEVPNGLLPQSWSLIADSLGTYQEKEKTNAFTVYQNIGGVPANGPDLLKPITGFDWYLRMTTISGCTDSLWSIPSERVRIIELRTNNGGFVPSPPRAGTALSWNRAKPLTAASKPYFIYESPTTYYIWENDSVDNGGIGDSANWYLRGSTRDTNYNVPSNLCGGYAAFRVEARDTIISRAKGQGINADSLITLTFSTFSTIDTHMVVGSGGSRFPRLDTLEVLENGDVSLIVDVVNSGTIQEYKFYDGAVPNGLIIDSLIKSKRTTKTIVGAGATAGTAEQTVISGIAAVIGTTKEYSLKAIDACDTTRFADGETYSTISPYGELSSTCPLIFELNWNQPSGYNFSFGVDYYKIYNKGKWIQTISGANNTTTEIRVESDSMYEFQVIAVDRNSLTNREAVNISAKLSYRAPIVLRTDELVPGPDLKCSFVEQNGHVILSFDPPLDSTANGVSYEFEYRTLGGNWTTFSNSSLVAYDDSTVTITGINAQNQQYDFRAKTFSGCSGTATGDFGDTVSSIFVQATPRGDVFKRGDLVWNDDAVPNENPYHVYKYSNGLFYQDSRLGSANSSPYVDMQNAGICNLGFNYHIDIEVPTLRDHLSYRQKRCLSRSNITAANYLDTVPPMFVGTISLDGDTLKAKTESKDDTFQWLRCTYNSGLLQYVMIPGATQANYIPNDTGHFAVQIQDECGNTDVSDCIPVFPVGIEEIPFQDRVSFYPNPTNGTVNIVFGNSFYEVEMQVRNIQGQLLAEKHFVNQQQVEVDLPGKIGIYFLQLTNEKGERANLKVVKQ